jgi:hypothetical protein
VCIERELLEVDVPAELENEMDEEEEPCSLRGTVMKPSARRELAATDSDM